MEDRGIVDVGLLDRDGAARDDSQPLRDHPLAVAQKLRDAACRVSRKFFPAQERDVVEKGAGLGVARHDPGFPRGDPADQEIGEGERRAGSHEPQAAQGGKDPFA
jgi:hypothetical protein